MPPRAGVRAVTLLGVRGLAGPSAGCAGRAAGDSGPDRAAIAPDEDVIAVIAAMAYPVRRRVRPGGSIPARSDLES